MKNSLFVLILFSAQVIAQIPTTGLVGHYPFTGGSTNDFSAFNANGTGTNVTPTLDRFGNAGDALYFDGSSSVVVLPNNMLNRGSITISLWFKTNSPGGIIGQQNRGYILSNQTGWVANMYVNDNNNLHATTFKNNNSNVNTVLSDVTDNNWHHAVIAGNGGGISCYIDGVAVGTATGGGLVPGLAFNQIGVTSATNWPLYGTQRLKYFKGAIDDVRIYNRVLTSAEVTSLYEEANTGTTYVNSIASYKFSGNALDSSGNGLNGTPLGVVDTTDRFGNSQSAYYFNGSSSQVRLPDSLLLKDTLSIALWFKASSNAGGIIGQQSNIITSISSQYTPNLYIANDSTNNLYGSFTKSNSNNVNKTTINVVDSTWHHVVLSGTREYQNIYIDGVFVGSDTGIVLNVSTNVVSNQIGVTYAQGFSGHTLGNMYFEGIIDDVQIFDRPLSNIEAAILAADTLVAPLPPPLPIKVGLIADFPFNNGSVLDATSNANDGINVGLNASPTFDRFGNVNAALSFNGSNSEVRLPDGLLERDSISISLWFKTGDAGGIIGIQNNPVGQSSTAWNPFLYINSAGNLHGTFYKANTSNILSSNVPVAAQLWHHVVISGDLNSQEIYVDGVLSGTGAGITSSSIMPKNQIGATYATGWPNYNTLKNFFTGSIDDVKIYDRKITAAEALELYNEVDTGTTKVGNTARYLFSGNAADSSGSNNNGTAINVTDTTDRFGNPASAYYFNGTNSQVTMPDNLLRSDVRSISVWIKTTQKGRGIIGHQQNALPSSNTFFVPLMYVDGTTTGNLHATFLKSTGNANINQQLVNVADGSWHHLVLAASTNYQQVFIDGRMVGMGQGAVFNFNLSKNQIGVTFSQNWPNIGNGNQFFDGIIDDVNIYSRQISNIEVDSLFAAGGYTPPIPVGLVDELLTNNNTYVFPNPSNGLFQLTGVDGAKSIEVFGLNGQQIRHVISSKNQVDLSTYPQGVYLLKIVFDNKILTKKLIKY